MSGSPQFTDPKDVPFRWQIRTADEAELARLNAAEGRTGARAFEPAEATLARMAEVGRTSKQRMDAWVHHPDERVVLELIGKAGEGAERIGPGNIGVEIDGPWMPGTDEARQHLTARLHGEAVRDGHLWTPLIDRMHAFAPGPDTWRREYKYSKVNTLYRLEQLKRWMRRETNPRAIELLLNFRDPSLLQAVAQEARCVDAAMVQRLLAGEMREHFARNPNLTPGAVRLIVDEVLDDAERVLSQGRAPEHFDLLVHLDQTGHPVPDDVFDRLQDVARAPAVSGEVRAQAATALARLGRTTPEELQGLYEVTVTEAGHRTALGRGLALNPNTPLPVLRDLVAPKNRGPMAAHLRAAEMAHNPAALMDPVTRRAIVSALRAAKDKDEIERLFVALAKDAGPDELVTIWMFAGRARRGRKLLLEPVIEAARIDLSPVPFELLQGWFEGNRNRWPELLDLAVFPAARANGEYMRALLDANTPVDRLRQLWGDFPADAAARLLGTLMEWDHREAVALLKANAGARAALTMGQVTQLLQSDDRNVRMEAALLLPALRKRVAEQAADSPVQGR